MSYTTVSTTDKDKSLILRNGFGFNHTVKRTKDKKLTSNMIFDKQLNVTKTIFTDVIILLLGCSKIFRLKHTSEELNTFSTSTLLHN